MTYYYSNCYTNSQ